MTTSMHVAFHASETLLQMLQLDEPTLYYGEYKVTRRRARGAQAFVVTCSERAAALMLDDCESRSTSFGGWDQPSSWYRVAQVHARRIAVAISIWNPSFTH